MKMKNKMLLAIFSIVIIVTIGYSVFYMQKRKNISDLLLANVEALAEWENGKFYSDCWLGSDNGSSTYFIYTDCRDCLSRSGVYVWAPNQCAFWWYLKFIKMECHNLNYGILLYLKIWKI